MSTIEIMWLKEYTKHSESINSGNEIDIEKKKREYAHAVHRTLGRHVTWNKSR